MSSSTAPVERVEVERPAAADESPHAGRELAQLERLEQVIIGAAVEARHPVIDRSTSGDDENRGVDALLSGRLQKIYPIGVR